VVSSEWIRGVKLLLVAAEGWEIRQAPAHLTKVITGVACAPGDLEADVVVNAGVCGALDPSLAPGDIIVASSVNGTAVAQPRSTPAAVKGPLLTVDGIVATAEQKRQLYARTGAMAVDMEAAGILSQVKAARFCCVKVVLDTAAESFALDLDEALVNGRFSRTRILAQAARHPREVVPELLRLRRRRDDAAKALGDFLAGCTF
jgi:adenosylhomocysteine nucleosidase